jgi:hypothetical protein
MSSFVLVDTNIWHFGLVKPMEEPFLEIHNMANTFLTSVLLDPDTRIGLSCYQVGEILEVLRRSGMPVDSRLRLLEDFKKGKFFVKPLDPPTVTSAAKDSMQSNIHIYDYLVAYPLKGVVTRIYSADAHFNHKDFRKIGEIVNPLSPWVVLEGKSPARTP